jgi:hypothetical protein
MPRVPSLTCSDCGRKFAGDSNERRHRVIAGDRYKCQTDTTLRARGWYRDSEYVWHRPMSGQISLLEDSDSPQGDLGGGIVPTPANVLARVSDPLTSKVAAMAVAYRTGTQKARLLEAYRLEPEGLTDDEAGIRVGLPHAWKRCSDLRNDGMIEPVGVKPGPHGTPVMVCRVSA